MENKMIGNNNAGHRPYYEWQSCGTFGQTFKRVYSYARVASRRANQLAYISYDRERHSRVTATYKKVKMIFDGPKFSQNETLAKQWCEDRIKGVPA